MAEKPHAHHVAPPGIRCPACQAAVRGAPRAARARVCLFTRHRPGSTYRVLRCPACGRRFRTVERIESVRA